MLLALSRRALAISMRRTWPDGAKQATGTPRPSAKNGKLLTPFAREHCKSTTATSPRWGAWRGGTSFRSSKHRAPTPRRAIRQADELASRALAIDPNDYWAHFSKAGVLMAQNRHEEAIVQAERSLALNPSFMEGYEILCLANNFLGRPDRAMEYADTAIRLSPRDPYIFGNYHAKGWAFFMKEQDDHAIEWLRRSAAAAPGAEPFTYLLLASAYALNGRQAEAQDELKRYLSLSRTKTTTIAELRKQQLSLADNPKWVAYNERLFEGLRKAGMPEE